MSLTPSLRNSLLSLSGFFFLTVAVTIAVFAVFIPGPERGLTFYVSTSLVCAAELVVFANLVHSKLAQAGMPAASTATRFQVHVLIVIWFIATVVVAVLANNPDRADTFLADRALVMHLVLTLVFLAVAWFMFNKDVQLAEVDRKLEGQQQALRALVPGVDEALRTLDELTRNHPSHALEADRVRKKLDATRTELDVAVVSERSAGTPASKKPGQAISVEQRVGRLVYLANQYDKLKPEQITDLLKAFEIQADGVLKSLEQRERTLMN